MFSPYTEVGGQAMVSEVEESDKGQNGKMPEPKPADQEKFQDNVQEEPGGMMHTFTFVFGMHSTIDGEVFMSKIVSVKQYYFCL